MICIGKKKISLIRRVPPAPSSPENTSRLPYVYGVTNYRDMVTATLDDVQCYCKEFRDETIKINVYTSDSYRRLIKQFQADNVIHHTYHPRGERAYRVVLRHLHHSIHPDIIKSELEGLEHSPQCAQYPPLTNQGPFTSLLCGP